MADYLIRLYTTSSGKKIIDDFVTKLDVRSQLKVREAIRLLRRYGLTLLNTQE